MRSSFLKVKVIRWMFLLTLCVTALIATNVLGQRSDSSDKPRFSEYKGVKIGTSVTEARQKLGKSEQENNVQETFTFSDKENVRVFYDEEKVTAIIVMYMGKSSGAPTPETVLGEKVETKPDGSIYKMIQYPTAGFWVAYSYIPGDDPLTMITIQKMPTSK